LHIAVSGIGSHRRAPKKASSFRAGDLLAQPFIDAAKTGPLAPPINP
jgi:hypothetical protein